MSPEDKKRIQQEGESFGYSMSPMVAELASMYYQAYIKGAEAEFNRREKLINEFERIIADGCSNCREFREEFAIALKKYKS